MLEIKSRLDLHGIDHFCVCNHLMPLHFKGLIKKIVLDDMLMPLISVNTRCDQSVVVAYQD